MFGLHGQPFLGPLNAFSVEIHQNASMELIGKVVTIDIQERQIVLEYSLDSQEIVTSSIFDVSETTKIYKNNEIVPISEILEGDLVAVTYQIDEDDNKVVSRLSLEN